MESCGYHRIGDSRRRVGDQPKGERVRLGEKRGESRRRVGDQPKGEREEGRREELWLNARGLDRKVMIVLD